MKTHTAILAGATGLVGGECLHQLLASPRYGRVVVVTRRAPDPVLGHDKLRVVVADFERLGDVRSRLRGDHVFCALGTTIRKAGSQQRFREVDYEYPLRLAQLALKNGARHFSVVSALGASRSSPFFYSRVKGDMEDGLRQMGWPSLAVLRPSVIAGKRAETRPFERLSGHLLRFAPSTWRPVAARDIAAAMIATALRESPGITVIESRHISGVAQQLD